MPIYHAAQIFEPFYFNANECRLCDYSMDLHELTSCEDEWLIYRDICKDYCARIKEEDSHLLSFWHFYKNRLPKFYRIATWILVYQTNSAEAERSISRYNNILTNDRNRLSEYTIQKLNYIQFNNQALSCPRVGFKPLAINFNEPITHPTNSNLVGNDEDLIEVDHLTEDEINLIINEAQEVIVDSSEMRQMEEEEEIGDDDEVESIQPRI